MSKIVIINDHRLVQKGREKKNGSHLMKCLLTELRPSRQENIQPFVTTYGLLCISNTCIIFFLNMKIPFHRINF